jgi:hypothetical protein
VMLKSCAAPWLNVQPIIRLKNFFVNNKNANRRRG